MIRAALGAVLDLCRQQRAKSKVKTQTKAQNPPAAAPSNLSHSRLGLIRLLSKIENSL